MAGSQHLSTHRAAAASRYRRLRNPYAPRPAGACHRYRPGFTQVALWRSRFGRCLVVGPQDQIAVRQHAMPRRGRADDGRRVASRPWGDRCVHDADARQSVLVPQKCLSSRCGRFIAPITPCADFAPVTRASTVIAGIERWHIWLRIFLRERAIDAWSRAAHSESPGTPHRSGNQSSLAGHRGRFTDDRQISGGVLPV